MARWLVTSEQVIAILTVLIVPRKVFIGMKGINAEKAVELTQVTGWSSMYLPGGTRHRNSITGNSMFFV
ncbi:hypothetical protein ACJMPS_004886 [Salmonella enterica subsp. enterica serovar Newport]